MEKNKKKATGGTRGVMARYENISSFIGCSRRLFFCAYG